MRYRLPLFVFIISLGCFALQAQAQDAGKEQELLRVIKEQQQQLETQQKQLDAQIKLLQELQSEGKEVVEEAKKEFERLAEQIKQQQENLDSLNTVAESKTPSEEAVSMAQGAKPVKKAPAKIVTSAGGERVRLAISGHINRMVMIVDDGVSTDPYFVDNDNSESQVRFIGSSKVSHDLTLGGIIELSIAPNKSGNVNQLNQEINNIFDQRRTELILESKRWGKLWLGKGFTSSYSAGAVDLSGTGVITYSVVSDTAASLIWRESDTGAFTDIIIFDAFNSFEGLNRANRLRYDTPKFGGFHLAASAVSESRYDASLWGGGQGYGFNVAGAVAAANPNLDYADLQYNGSISVLHKDTGLNLTLASGMLERTDQENQHSYFTKLGWMNKFFSAGDTAFSVDYARTLNQPAENDDGNTVAVAAVQHFEKYGAELYGLYRLYSLDRSIEPSVDDITIVSIGARVKF